MSDYIVKDTELTSVANAIRIKGGTNSQLVFPGGFVSAIGNISGGGGSSDFSTAEVTITANADILFYGAIALLDDLTYDDASYTVISVRAGHPETFNVIMYKGAAILINSDDAPFANVSLSGSLELIDDDYAIKVTGDGTITIS